MSCQPAQVWPVTMATEYFQVQQRFRSWPSLTLSVYIVHENRCGWVKTLQNYLQTSVDFSPARQWKPAQQTTCLPGQNLLQQAPIRRRRGDASKPTGGAGKCAESHERDGSGGAEEGCHSVCGGGVRGGRMDQRGGATSRFARVRQTAQEDDARVRTSAGRQSRQEEEGGWRLRLRNHRYRVSTITFIQLWQVLLLIVAQGLLGFFSVPPRYSSTKVRAEKSKCYFILYGCSVIFFWRSSWRVVHLFSHRGCLVLLSVFWTTLLTKINSRSFVPTVANKGRFYCKSLGNSLSSNAINQNLLVSQSSAHSATSSVLSKHLQPCKVFFDICVRSWKVDKLTLCQNFPGEEEARVNLHVAKYHICMWCLWRAGLCGEQRGAPDSEGCCRFKRGDGSGNVSRGEGW